MKKIAILLLSFLSLVFTTGVYAYSGSHSFNGMVTTTSDGHTYKSEYTASGSFPYNGAGSMDRSKVNLKGIFTVSEADGVPTGQNYCASLKGGLKPGNRLTATYYTDTTCATVAGTTNYTVSSYSEDGVGNFMVVAKDANGVVTTTTGVHGYIK
ncbi:MAG: hypothetical protein Q8Q15_00870 [bacterium]|nr:hypothetical protein [bacterium]